MKVRPSVKPICDKCKIIRRHELLERSYLASACKRHAHRSGCAANWAVTAVRARDERWNLPVYGYTRGERSRSAARRATAPAVRGGAIANGITLRR